MRLIDADELKKALTNKDLITWTHEYGDAIPVDWLMSIIDNAPTVTTFTLEDIEGIRAELYDGQECIAIRKDCIITKEEFLECYNEWVVKPLQENPVSLQHEFVVPVDNGGGTPV